MLGLIGKTFIDVAFVLSLGALYAYFKAGNDESNVRMERIGHYLYASVGLLMLLSGALLLYLVLTHQFQYYYVYEYTSKDLPLKYLISAFYSGQEGSFILWIFLTILFSGIVARFTSRTYRAPMLFFTTLAISFLLSMILGIQLGTIHIGASPFRTLAEAMPNAPFIKAHPNFVPADGTGLNDLLRSPYILIHPPILFSGFAMMTIPFAFAMAALWKRKYDEWFNTAIPWTLAANVCLFTAIFLGGYWAYVTLSFGGYWAWDPVENASLVPWIFGVAGIHMMLIQRKNGAAKKSAVLFAILAYLAIVYEAFLTRSGILGNSSVHSFVDLGLYNQLLIFMAVISIIALGLYFYRYKDLNDGQPLKVSLLNREFLVFTGAIVLLMTGIVILIGTSSPIIGKLFVSNPTPPKKSFYNDWTMPFAILLAILTVLGQYQWWKKYDAETLSSALLGPLMLTSIVTMVSIVWGQVTNIAYMVYLFAGFFAVFGNGAVLIRMIRKNPRRVGGTITHVGFAIMLIGILTSSGYNETLLTPDSVSYNNAVKKGLVKDKDGTPIVKPINFFELDKGQPKKIGKNLIATFESVKMDNANHPGGQMYTIRIQDANDTSKSYLMKPIVYPMMESSTAKNINWAVNPEVRAGWLSDIYMYVGNSSYVENINKRAKAEGSLQPVSDIISGGSSQAGAGDATSKGQLLHDLTFHRGDSQTVGDYTFTFKNFQKATGSAVPDSAVIAVRAIINIKNNADGTTKTVKPLFAVVQSHGKKVTYSPPISISNWHFGIQFRYVKPMSDQIQIRVDGISGVVQKASDSWVVVVAERKPFISLVWIGVFIIIGGFLVSVIYRRRESKMRISRMSKMGEA